MKLADIDLNKFAPEAPTAEPVPTPANTIEFVAKRAKFLTADGQSATPLEQEALFDGNDLLDVHFLDRCILVRGCVGRIEVIVPSKRGWATGFLIAPGLLLTNHHVFPDAASVGVSTISFDYWFDVAGQRPVIKETFDFRPDELFVTSKNLDYTVVALGERSNIGNPISARRHLRMIQESGKAKEGEFVTIFQHPEGAPMQIALRENEVVRAAEQDPFIWYRADTAYGSSGACVTNNSLQVVALHSGGRIKRDGERYVLANGDTTDSLEGLSETDVQWEANAGYRISRIAADMQQQVRERWPQRLALIEEALRGGDVLSTAVEAPKVAALPTSPQTIMPQEQETMMVETPKPQNLQSAAGFGGLVIPLQLRVSLEPAGFTEANAVLRPATGAETVTTALEAERLEMRMPIIHDRLETRKGFQRRFLDEARDVPGPKVTDAGKAVLAPLLDGSGTELRYAHFSVWMHRERRMALYTASNVDWRKRRKVVDGQKTDRDTLAGWPGEDNIAELWSLDDRMDAAHQLPDVFYTNDRGAFDKGHLVRRDDVCWGRTFEEIQKANGDTFHVTNCSPQRKEFNQGSHGQENWGDLETMIQDVTDEDRQAACIYSGPVLRANDRWFDGEDDAGSVSIRIPREYWKIIVVKGDADFEAYGFLIQQQTRDVTEHEFYVTDEWLAALKPISEIQELMRDWLDLSDMTQFDRYASIVVG